MAARSAEAAGRRVWREAPVSLRLGRSGERRRRTIVDGQVDLAYETERRLGDRRLQDRHRDCHPRRTPTNNRSRSTWKPSAARPANPPPDVLLESLRYQLQALEDPPSVRTYETSLRVLRIEHRQPTGLSRNGRGDGAAAGVDAGIGLVYGGGNVG